MELKKETYHNHTFYRVNNKRGLEITFCSLGASIYSIKYRNHYVTYHEEDYDKFFNSLKFSGKTLGRVAGRIKDAVIKVNNKYYHLEKNEKNNTLHGGKHSLSFKDFEVSLSENEELINVVFKYTSPKLECGFPGEVRVIVVYSISKKENKFSIHYHVNASELTPISLAPHIYWRLLDQDILSHRLKINANYISKLDKQLIILGKEKVKKIYDFSKEKRIGQDIKEAILDNPSANGYDCGFILNESNEPQIVIKNAGIKLSVKTDMNMALIYTNGHFGKDKMLGYGLDKQYGGVAIEPQMYPANFKDLLIDKDHPFDHYISFHLEDY